MTHRDPVLNTLHTDTYERRAKCSSVHTWTHTCKMPTDHTVLSLILYIFQNCRYQKKYQNTENEFMSRRINQFCFIFLT